YKEENKGILKKINDQIEAFEESGIHMDKDCIRIYSENVFAKIAYRIPFTNMLPYWKYKEEYANYDFIYLRRPMYMNFWFIWLCRKVRKKGVKIILEFPTYPYDKEIYLSFLSIPLIVKERIARFFLGLSVDRISLLTEDNNVYGVKTLHIRNGYNFKETSIRNIKEIGETIDIAIVAYFRFWHGYERLINGLCDYYKQNGKRKIHLHFVGDGTELVNYKKLCEEKEISRHVTFYGVIEREDILKIYDKCDIGACTFGDYKKDNFYSCELKSREYLAVGLPLITGVKLDVSEYDSLSPFILEFPNNSTPIEFEKVIQFYDNLYKDKTQEKIKEMAENIHSKAEKELNIKKAMENVISYVQKGEPV
ncbi:MAG: glycosyltransferase family 4 protein, partial [Hungatella sp.]|nr:glycosyltransferase family 4 protein [Hungatella sp.]